MRTVTHIFFLMLYINYGAQQLYFSIPDKLKQIPSSESYKVMQDSKGYIWFSTEAGLCRFNGNSLRVFDKKNGLPEGAVYCIEEDKKGNIWIATAANRILYYDYEKDSLKEARFSKNFEKLLANKINLIYCLNIKDDTVFINVQKGTYKAGMYFEEVKKVKPWGDYNYQFVSYKNFLLYIENKGENRVAWEKIAKKKGVEFAIKGRTTRSVIVPYLSSIYPSWRVLTVVNKKNDYFISFDHVLVKVSADGTYSSQQISNPILDLYIDKDDGLWMGTLKGGVYYYEDGKNLDEPVINLAGFSVSGTCEDREKGVWCTTLEKGVFYCRNKYIKSYPEIRGFGKKAELLKTIGSSVFISTEENQLVEIKNSRILYHPLHTSNLYILNDILRMEDSTWLISGSAVIKADKRFNNLEYLNLEDIKSSVHARQITYGPGERIFAIQTNALFEIRNQRIFGKNLIFNVGKCLHYPGGDSLLFGCKEGLYSTNVNNFKCRKVRGIKGAVTKIHSAANKDLWIITKGNGMYVIKNSRIFSMGDSLKLPTDRFLDITEDKFGALWIGSNIGLIKIVHMSGRLVATIYTMLNGLPSNEIFNVAAGEKELYLSTNEGICSFPLKADLLTKDKPEIIMSKVWVNGEEIRVKDNTLKLSHNENTMEINLVILTFKGKQTLLYFLSGKNNTLLWGMSNGNNLLLNHIKPGKYELKIFAVNSDKRVSARPVILELKINKPFWRTTGFIFLCNVVICLAAVFTTRIMITRVRKKEREKTRINKLIAEFQLSALRAQMNPHFIFNCINSIQRYILTNKPEEAYSYLSKFSKLIRLVLNYAEENLITLTQELEILTLYIELEQLRFEHKFRYVISIDEHVNIAEIKVPAMILQPYVENAIWHGLMNVKDERDKFISLSIKEKNSVLEIVIEDNGVGREKASELSSKTYQSRGTRINNRRIEMLNILGSGKGSVQIEDLSENSMATGTRVIISIPQHKDDE